MHPSSFLRREATSGTTRSGRRRTLTLLAPLVGAIAAATLLVAPSLARADSSATLTVIGTSDVSDSGLIPQLIQPEFQAAYPQFTFRYIGTATGTAITNAENGSQGASVLIVHAAALENQFVAGGYSYEPYGRALWTNDFVLAGPAAQDPAGVSANASSNIEQSFADIAAAGVNGGGGATPRATFVSRGGTPGTTVEEHQIWASVDQQGLVPTGVQLCTVPATLGGGQTPIDPATSGLNGNGQPCPGGVLPGSMGGGALPNWYIATGLTQGPNVVAANACTGSGQPGGIQSGANSCYVFTDRGTYDYLLDGGTTGTTANTIANLAIRTRNPSQLTNYFHGYIINPAKVPTGVNLPAAEAFINFITSPTIQGQLSSYLANTPDPGGPPFVADASPAISASGFPANVGAGQPVTVAGSIANRQPGYAVPANQTVTVDRVVGGVPIPVASTTTDGSGAYSITFTPPASGQYQVSTGLISLIEPLGLNPAYGDELSPAATATSPITVQASANIGSITTSAGAVNASGSVLPAAPDGATTATLLARPQSSTAPFKPIGTDTLPQGQGTYAVSGSLPGGKWTVVVSYGDGANLLTATTGPRNVTVPSTAVKLSFAKIKLKHGKLTLQGKLSQGPVGSSATVKLYARSVGKIKTKGHTSSTNKKHKTGSGKKKSALVVVANAKNKKKSHSHFKQVAKTTVKIGHKTYTLRHKFTRGHRYVLQLRYSHTGQRSTSSKFKYLNVR